MKKPTPLEFIDDIIEMELWRDEEWKRLGASLHKWSMTQGESPVLNKLKLLKELLQEEDRNKMLSQITPKFDLKEIINAQPSDKPEPKICSCQSA